MVEQLTVVAEAVGQWQVWVCGQDGFLGAGEVGAKCWHFQGGAGGGVECLEAGCCFVVGDVCRAYAVAGCCGDGAVADGF